TSPYHPYSTTLSLHDALPIYVGQDGRDTQDAINRLADIVPQGIRADDVFTHLITIVQEQGTRAGTLDNARLRALLLQRGVSLSRSEERRVGKGWRCRWSAGSG